MSFFRGKKWPRILGFGVLIGALVMGVALRFLPDGPQSGSEGVDNPEQACSVPEMKDGAKRTVVKVVDGDTFILPSGKKVRLLGIDAPERGERCFNEATRELRGLIENKAVRLEKGAEPLDQYCRYLRYVFIDNQNVSRHLLEKGLARTYFGRADTERFISEFEEQEGQAKQEGRGCLWDK